MEYKHDIRILYACEYGDREWWSYEGTRRNELFKFDIHFIYIHKNASNNETSPISDFFSDYLKDLRVSLTGYHTSEVLARAQQMDPALIEMLFASRVYKLDTRYDFFPQLRHLIRRFPQIAKLSKNYQKIGLAVWNYYNTSAIYTKTVRLEDYLLLIRISIIIEWLIFKYEIPGIVENLILLIKNI